MEELKKLVRIVTLFSPKKISLVDLSKTTPSNKEERLFLNVKESKYANDKEAIIDIYGASKKTYRYRMLKSRLRQKLYTHLFFIENINSLPKKEEKKCLDFLYRGKALLLVAEYSIAEQLYNKALKIAEQYEFTDVVLDCLSNLNFIYTQIKDYPQFHKSLKKFKYYKKLKDAEDKAYELYYVSKLELQKSIAAKKKYINKLPSIISTLKELWEKSNSFNIFYYYYFLNGWYLELMGNFEESIKDIENCEKLIMTGKINQYRFDLLLNKYSLIYALFRAKKYEEGLNLAPKYLKDFNPYSRNWFSYMDQYFLLAMHAERYLLAVDVIIEVDQNPSFKRLLKRGRETWALYKAYLYFLNPHKSIISTFNYQQFINSVPEHSKDKLGHNIALHILQFLYHLKNKDHDQLYYKEGALRKYLSAYLKDIDSQRSRYFFRLLIVVIRADFNLEKSVKKGQRWLEKLKAAPEPGDAYAKIEIIPYEKLWELVLDLMKEK